MSTGWFIPKELKLYFIFNIVVAKICRAKHHFVPSDSSTRCSSCLRPINWRILLRTTASEHHKKVQVWTLTQLGIRLEHNYLRVWISPLLLCSNLYETLFVRLRCLNKWPSKALVHTCYDFVQCKLIHTQLILLSSIIYIFLIVNVIDLHFV